MVKFWPELKGWKGDHQLGDKKVILVESPGGGYVWEYFATKMECLGNLDVIVFQWNFGFWRCLYFLYL